jgi:hypothetical protein
MIASRAGAIATDRETRMKLKARACCSACLTQLTEVRQRSGEIEVRYRKISVGLDGSSQPYDRFGIFADKQWRWAEQMVIMLASVGQRRP